MIRPLLSYALTSLILLSQVGLPLHMHYCKGVLEKVSVLFSAECDDHAIPANLPACCKKALASHCLKKEGKKCCDDEVILLKQDISSVTPSFVKWIDVVSNIESPTPQLTIPQRISLPILIEGHNSDSGPPIYILNGSLVFYA